MKYINRKFTTTVALLLIMLSIAVPGAYAAPENIDNNKLFDMNVEDIKERNAEMIENSIDLLYELRSVTDDEYLIESIDDLLEKLESLDSELDSTEDSEVIKEIMDNYRALIVNSPDQIREALMQGNSRDLENMDRNPREMGNNEITRKTASIGNNSMNNEETGIEKAVQEKDRDANNNENTGFLSGIIAKISSLFQ